MMMVVVAAAAAVHSDWSSLAEEIFASIRLTACPHVGAETLSSVPLSPFLVPFSSGPVICRSLDAIRDEFNFRLAF